jgi:Glycosyltransferase family 87
MRLTPGSWWGREDLRFLVPAVMCLVALIPIYVHSHYGHGDIDLYHRYASAFFVQHSLPYEYPVLSILPFLLALPPVGDYIVVYAAWMVVLFVAGYIAIHRFASARAANLYAVYIVLGGAITTLARFDLVPALVTVAALWAVSRRRFTLGYLLLALGVLLKLYPLFLLPIVMIEHRRVLHFRGGNFLPGPVLRGAGVFGFTVALGFLVAILLEPGGWWSPFLQVSHRPPEVESIPATLLWLTSFVGSSAVPDHSFHSFNLVGPAAAGLSTLGDLGLAAGCLVVYWRQSMGRIDVGRAFLAVVCVAIVSTKVFSPQYLVWALPLVAMIEGFSLTWIAISLLTTLIYPILFELDQLHGLGVPSRYAPHFLGAIAIRNGLMLLATWRAAFPRVDRETAALEDDERGQIPEYA